MPNFEAYSYEELLTENGKRNLHEELLIQNNSSALLVLIRLLSGSVKIVHEYTNTEINQRKNYFSSDYKSFGQSWGAKFPKLISEDISSNDIAMYIKANKYTNKIFYTNILTEVSHFLYASKKGSHTSAFIHVYRLLEKISYALPLIYASKTDDFVSSFNQLKRFMSGGDNKEELGFFKKFVESLFEGEPLTSTSLDISIRADNPCVQENFFNEMKRVLHERIIHPDTQEPTKLSINFTDFGSFIITIRNRFFHNMNKRADNINTQKVVDSDAFFKNVNDISMYWISQVLLLILSHLISNFFSTTQQVLPN
ncbi:hypothetical protein [Methylophaga thalassica]|uniref:hypothetical protein n=1 Tax=Methylophaga thalassica TaxID=40223 RepID=UPI002E7ACC7E|nr:hypothetical protein [Methylophaga thalassica]WVI85465.1 hypothetical protein VSX76_02340 [Methylophaga thalassica]